MRPISGMLPSTIYAAAAANKVKGSPAVQKPVPETEERPAAPRVDEYTPEEKTTPSGRYWMDRDTDGSPKIRFDAPEQTDRTPPAAPTEDEPKPDSPEQKRSGRSGQRCTASTDKVDREIRQLKKKRSELAQQLNAETDETKAERLQRQLAQIEQELSRKDNDTYRRQHMEITYS